MPLPGPDGSALPRPRPAVGDTGERGLRPPASAPYGLPPTLTGGAAIKEDQKRDASICLCAPD